jgi:putative membrane protein (TIGR04086 family)
MGRSIGAVIVGFMYALVIIGGTQFILFFAITEEPDAETLPPAHLILTIVWTFLAAVVGGFMAAQFARQAELAHGLAVGALLLVLLAVTTLVVETEAAPPWYQLALPLVALPGTLLGAWLRTRVRRPPPPAPPNPAG